MHVHGCVYVSGRERLLFCSMMRQERNVWMCKANMNVLARLHSPYAYEDVKEKRKSLPQSSLLRIRNRRNLRKPIFKTPSTHCSEFRTNSKCLQRAILPYMLLSAIQSLMLCFGSCCFSCTGCDLEVIRPVSCCKQWKWRDLTAKKTC